VKNLKIKPQRDYPILKTVQNSLKGCKRIGLFGGTFDPVHTGHLIIAETIYEKANLDVILFIPSARPPHKHHVLMFDAEQRFSMLSEAIKGNKKFRVSDIEMKREGPSYTIDTILEIKAELSPETELAFIVGRDNLYDMEMWKTPYDIIKECSILVADRICNQERDIPDWLKTKVQIVKVPLIEISSSEIRQRIRDGKSIRYMVPDVVIEEVKKLNH
jgi:nicotinate-nucleotide adenylyltransferase